MDAVIVDPEQVADVLEAAADYLAEHGWCQHTPHNEAGAACLAGALYEVCGGCWEAKWVLQRQLGWTASAWNDEPGREQWEVDELLRTTAKRVRAGDITVGR